MVDQHLTSITEEGFSNLWVNMPSFPGLHLLSQYTIHSYNRLYSPVGISLDD